MPRTYHVPHNAEGYVFRSDKGSIRFDGKYDMGLCYCCGAWDNDFALLCEDCHENHIQQCLLPKVHAEGKEP